MLRWVVSTICILQSVGPANWASLGSGAVADPGPTMSLLLRAARAADSAAAAAAAVRMAKGDSAA